ncbi:MAG: hypothetical protein RL701_6241 [Pseudomonadota bacterium]
MRFMTLGQLKQFGAASGVLGLVFASGCASSPQPTERLVSAQAAMRAAQEVGANGNPQAKLHAQLAREELERAKKLIEDGDNERAERLLLRATADAELAVAVTREGTSKNEATAAEGTATH